MGGSSEDEAGCIPKNKFGSLSSHLQTDAKVARSGTCPFSRRDRVA